MIYDIVQYDKMMAYHHNIHLIVIIELYINEDV